MSDWSGSKYKGDDKKKWYHGKGKFTFPNGVIYDGEFNKGEFHGEGTLIYPNGGKYTAKWDRGKMIEGDYFFHDDLKYEFQNWDYLTEDRDRRFYYERSQGFDSYSLSKPLPTIPEGTYDVGDGYYEPVASIVYTYEGQVSRTPNEKEVEWIIERCRYNPRNKGPLGGEEDKVINKAIQKSNQPPEAKKEQEAQPEEVQHKPVHAQAEKEGSLPPEQQLPNVTREGKEQQ